MTRTELADAMIRGKTAPGVEESKSNYITVMGLYNTCLACALGCALIGHNDGNFNDADETLDAMCDLHGDDLEVEILASLLDISPKLAVEIEQKHLDGMPVQQIAAWLKSSEGGEA